MRDSDDLLRGTSDATTGTFDGRYIHNYGRDLGKSADNEFKLNIVDTTSQSSRGAALSSILGLVCGNIFSYLGLFDAVLPGYQHT